MNKSIGSIEEKFVKQNHRYYKANDIEKNLYYGCLLAQSRHKDKVKIKIWDFFIFFHVNLFFRIWKWYDLRIIALLKI